MIDLHAHVLPGLDDGPRDTAEALELCRACVDDGVETVVATPHVSPDFPLRAEVIDIAAAKLRGALAENAIPLNILAGAEISHHTAPLLPDEELARLTLGDSSVVLLETPLGSGSVVELELQVRSLNARGYTVLLAHPERSPLFLEHPERLGRLVAAGAYCQVTVGALEGRFGRRAERLGWRLLEEGLIHDVSSDFHDLYRRPPGLSSAFEAAEDHHPGVAAARGWLTSEVPAALLAGEEPPEAPALAPDRRRRLWARLTG